MKDLKLGTMLRAKRAYHDNDDFTHWEAGEMAYLTGMVTHEMGGPVHYLVAFVGRWPDYEDVPAKLFHKFFATLPRHKLS